MTIAGTVNANGHAGLTSSGTGSYLLFDGKGGPDGADGDSGLGVGTFGSDNGGLSGGGGGGYGGVGGIGGGSFNNHGLGGPAYNADLSAQLMGGSGGTSGGASGAALWGGGGGGGGALGSLDISGVIAANGGTGGAPSSTFGNGGGGGGGSGGGILVQAGTLTVRPGAVISADGGVGGSSQIQNADVGGGGGGGGRVNLAYRYAGNTNGLISAAGGLGGYGGAHYPNNAVDIGAAGTNGTVVFAQSDQIPATQPVSHTPAISGFSPASGSPGTMVTVSGANFVGITNVQFGGVNANFVLISSTQFWTVPPAGAVNGPIQVAGSQGTTASTSNFTVTATTNSPPTVHFDTPTPGSVLSDPSFLVGATASDTDGTIARMDYYANGNQIYGLDTIQLFTVESSFTWTNVNAGTYLLTVIASDEAGAKAISAPLVLQVLPRLQIGFVGANVVVSWPASAAGFQLESTASLTPPVNWTADRGVPVVIGAQFQVIEGGNGVSRFYRLRGAQ